MAPAAVLTSMAAQRERPWAFPGVSAGCGARRVGISPGTEWRSGWRFQPLWKIWESVGMIIPNIWKNHIHVPNHQPEMVVFSPSCGTCEFVATTQSWRSTTFDLFKHNKHHTRRKNSKLVGDSGIPVEFGDVNGWTTNDSLRTQNWIWLNMNYVWVPKLNMSGMPGSWYHTN